MLAAYCGHGSTIIAAIKAVNYPGALWHGDGWPRRPWSIWTAGISEGMAEGIRRAEQEGRPVEHRRLHSASDAKEAGQVAPLSQTQQRTALGPLVGDWQDFGQNFYDSGLPLSF